MAYGAELHRDNRMSLDQLIALSDPDAHLTVGQDVWDLIKERRHYLTKHMAIEAIYGANTGVGSMKTYRPSPHQIGAFNDRLIRDHVAGFGRTLDRRVARLMMAVRIIELAQGGSGISPGAYQALVDAYNAGLTPVVPMQGSLGEGDITLLAHMAYALKGQGKMWRSSGRCINAARALKEAGLTKLRLEARDALALMGSNAYTAAVVIDVLDTWRQVRDAAIPVLALSWVAWRANPNSLKEKALSLVSSFVAQVGREVLAWIADTAPTPRDIQDPLSWRCAPHVMGALDRAAGELKAAVESLVQQPRDNPVILDDTDIVSNGNFDATDLSIRIDAVRNALARVVGQQAQRVTKLLNHHYSGLAPGLAHPYGDAGLGLLEFNVSALMTEVQWLSQGPLMQWGDVAEGVEDYGSLASVSALRLQQLIGLWKTMTATEWITAGHAIRTQNIGVVGPLGACYEYTVYSEGTSAVTPYDRVRRMEKVIATGAILFSEPNLNDREVLPRNFPGHAPRDGATAASLDMIKEHPSD